MERTSELSLWYLNNITMSHITANAFSPMIRIQRDMAETVLWVLRNLTNAVTSFHCPYRLSWRNILELFEACHLAKTHIPGVGHVWGIPSRHPLPGRPLTRLQQIASFIGSPPSAKSADGMIVHRWEARRSCCLVLRRARRFCCRLRHPGMLFVASSTADHVATGSRNPPMALHPRQPIWPAVRQCRHKATSRAPRPTAPESSIIMGNEHFFGVGVSERSIEEGFGSRAAFTEKPVPWTGPKL
jgi:hypothetical protein